MPVDGGHLWADDTGGEGPVLVLLHPGWGDSSIWLPVLERLPPHYRVIRYDTRGFGKSPAPAAPFSQVDDLAAVLDNRGGIDLAILAGHSGGGGTAIGLALADPARVRGLLLLAPGIPDYPWPPDDPYNRQFDKLYAAGDRDGIAELGLRTFFRTTRSVTASKLPWLWMSSRSWMRSESRRPSSPASMGGAVGRHHRGAVAGPLQGSGLGERVPDRQPGRQRGATAAAGRARLGVQVLLRPGRLRQVPRDFSKLIWQLASPKWAFDDATFARSAAAFDNPDHVSIVIHNYRWRLGLAAGESQYEDLEQRLADAPAIAVPTISLEGDANGAPHLDASAYASNFSGKYAQRVIEGGIGHNLPQEAPQAFAKAVVDVDGF